MQMLAGLVVGVMLAGGTYAVVKIVQIQRAEKATNASNSGLEAKQPDSGPAAGSEPAGTGTGTNPSGNAGGNTGGNTGGNAGASALEVPNMIGISAETAINELRQRGIKEVRLTSDSGQGIDATKSAEWTVVKQSEKPGARVGASTIITLTCTRGY
jgi:hypothetical protein